jgi:hypothetical protein
LMKLSQLNQAVRLAQLGAIDGAKKKVTAV